MSTNSVKEAIAYFLKRHGLVPTQVKLNETASPVSVVFEVDLLQAAQILCWNGRFDLAQDLRKKAERASFFLDPRGGSCFHELVEKADVAQDFHPDLAKALASLYLLMYRDPLNRAAEVLEAAEEACEGPQKETIKQFVTARGVRMDFEMEADRHTYVEDYFDSGEPEVDWQDMEHAAKKPFSVFNLTCTLRNPRGKTLGSAQLCRCSADRDALHRDALRTYGRDLLNQAVYEARQHFPPKQPRHAITA